MHNARPVLLDLADRSDLRLGAQGWQDRVDVHTATTDDRPADALLIRPDGHIAWAAAIEEPVDAAGDNAAGSPLVLVRRARLNEPLLPRRRESPWRCMFPALVQLSGTAAAAGPDRDDERDGHAPSHTNPCDRPFRGTPDRGARSSGGHTFERVRRRRQSGSAGAAGGRHGGLADDAWAVGLSPPPQRSCR